MQISLEDASDNGARGPSTGSDDGIRHIIALTPLDNVRMTQQTAGRWSDTVVALPGSGSTKEMTRMGAELHIRSKTHKVRSERLDRVPWAAN
jgi:hypothetical protein